MRFNNILFSSFKFVSIYDSVIVDAVFISCKWADNIRSLNVFEVNNYKNTAEKQHEELVALSDVYRQLKIAMSKQNSKIEENYFYSREMNYYNKTLKCDNLLKKEFGDKIILTLSSSISDYGQNFLKPVYILFIGHFVWFFIAISLGAFEEIGLSYSNILDCSAEQSIAIKDSFELFFVYINPFRSFDTTFSGYLIVLDYIMRIWSSYLIYVIIRASRRFILK